MDVSNRVTQLEDEIKVLKNELLTVLLDVKENLLTRENPFNQQPAQSAPQIIAFSQQSSAASEPAARQPAAPQEHLSQAEPAAPITIADEFECDDSFGVDESEMHESIHNRDEENHLSTTPETAPDDSDDNVWVDELVKSWRPLEASELMGKSESRLTEAGTGSRDRFSNNISLATLSGLAAWVTQNSMALGAERVQTIFDIAEMMGDIPSELKMTLEKLIPHNSKEAQVDSEQIPAQSYLSALKELATLLGKDNVTDFVVMHMVSHGLNSRRKGTS